MQKSVYINEKTGFILVLTFNNFTKIG